MGVDRATRDSHCTDKHKAGTETSKTSERYNRTGMFATFCPHGFVLCGCHMHEGERYAYAAMCLYLIVKETKGPIDFCWYDIGPCKFRLYWVRFVDSLPSDMATEEEKGWMRAIRFPLCTFHRYMHVAICQRAYAAELPIFKGAGTGVGEPPEQFWAKMGRMADRMQYSRLSKTGAVFEAFIDVSNDKQDVRARYPSSQPFITAVPTCADGLWHPPL